MERVSSVTDVLSLLGRVPVKRLSCCLLPSHGGSAALSSGESLLLLLRARKEPLLYDEAVGGRRRQLADKWVNDTLIMIPLKD